MLRTARTLGAGCLLLLASGCTLTPPKLDPELRPRPTAALTEARSAATECDSPAPGRVDLSRSFKYGCFCGVNYPDLPTPENKPFALLSETERQTHIARFYAIKPIDDIDSACQDHDVCWLLRGDGDGRCNEEFKDRLDYVRDAMNSKRKVFDTDSYLWRCEILADDMYTIFLTIFVSEQFSDSPGKTVGSWLGRAFGTVMTPLIAALRVPIWARKAYPAAQERCVLPADNESPNS
jgi:hypothetical protein